MADRFVSFMSRHLVALQVDCEYTKGEVHRSGSEPLSGFILELHDRWFWVTAGHCLRELDEAVGNGVLQIHGGGFVDYFQVDAPHHHPIPFTYEAGCGGHIYDNDAGLDFGVICLSDLVAKNMAANRVVPISRENWVHQPSLTFSAYKMLGLPSHLIEKHGGYMPVMIAIDPLDPATLSDSPPETCFAGRIHREATIDSIKGMSGGPIFGFRQGDNGKWYYYVVAIQSRWRERERITFGCSLPFVAELMHEMLS